MLAQDGQVAAAANRPADRVESMTAVIQAAAQTIADAIRRRPGAYANMPAQGTVR